jgi:hypothetical protein
LSVGFETTAKTEREAKRPQEYGSSTHGYKGLDHYVWEIPEAHRGRSSQECSSWGATLRDRKHGFHAFSLVMLTTPEPTSSSTGSLVSIPQ